MLNFPPTHHVLTELDFGPSLLCSVSAFLFSPLSLYPHFSYSSSVSVYPVSKICITKAYYITLAYGKGTILCWRVKGIRGRRNEVDKNSILFVNQVRAEDCEASHVNNSCHQQI